MTCWNRPWIVALKARPAMVGVSPAPAGAPTDGGERRSLSRRQFLRRSAASGLAVVSLPALARGAAAERDHHIFFRHGAGKDNGKGAISVVTPGDKPTHVLDLPARYVEKSMALSPDGAFLAFCTYERRAPNESRNPFHSVFHVFDVTSRTDHTRPLYPQMKIYQRVHWGPKSNWVSAERAQIEIMHGIWYDMLTGFTIDPQTQELSGAKHHYLGAPSFSPDGVRVAYETSGSTLAITAAENVVIKEGRMVMKGTSLTLSGYLPKQPIWSPRGDLILYHAQPDAEEATPRTLWVTDPEGKASRQITDQGYIATLRSDRRGPYDVQVGNVERMFKAATWSPNGAHLAFKVHPQGKALPPEPPKATRKVMPAGQGFKTIPAPPPEKLVIQRYDVDTQHSEAITTPLFMPTYRYLAHWSPNGTALAFPARETVDAPNALWTVNADGANLQPTNVTDVNEVIGWR